MKTEKEKEVLITHRTFMGYVLNVRITFREKTNYNVLSNPQSHAGVPLNLNTLLFDFYHNIVCSNVNSISL